jgi:hypothetical protein
MLLDLETIEGDKSDKEVAILERIEGLFEKYDRHSHKDDGIEFTHHPDSFINALIILDKYKKKPKGRVIHHSRDDQMFFDVDLFKVVTEMTEDELIEVIRSGIFMDNERFSKFL